MSSSSARYAHLVAQIVWTQVERVCVVDVSLNAFLTTAAILCLPPLLGEVTLLERNTSAWQKSYNIGTPPQRLNLRSSSGQSASTRGIPEDRRRYVRHVSVPTSLIPIAAERNL
jgi:hypothetical protein